MSDQQKEESSNLWAWLIGAGVLYLVVSLFWTSGFNHLDQLPAKLFTAQNMILFVLLCILGELERIRAAIVRQLVGISVDMEELIRISVHAESIATRMEALRYGQDELRREVSSIATRLGDS